MTVKEATTFYVNKSYEQPIKKVEEKIKGIKGVNDVEVELTFDPPYTQDMMSEAAKLELGFM